MKDYVRINLDTLHTRNKEKLVIEEAIKNKKNIVVDNTNLTKVYWARYIGQGISVQSLEMAMRWKGILCNPRYRTA